MKTESKIFNEYTRLMEAEEANSDIFTTAPSTLVNELDKALLAVEATNFDFYAKSQNCYRGGAKMTNIYALTSCLLEDLGEYQTPELEALKKATDELFNWVMS